MMRGVFSMPKEKRHNQIKEIISNHIIETQNDLVKYLKEAGFDVTQATISRDLKELNLIRIPLIDGRFRYGIPSESQLISIERFKRIIKEVCMKVEKVDHFVILKVLPGNAHVMGVLLDETDWEEIAGTVCGNDTCLIICYSQNNAEIIERRLKEMLIPSS